MFCGVPVLWLCLVLGQPAAAAEANAEAESNTAVTHSAAQAQDLVGLWGQVRVFPPSGTTTVRLQLDKGQYVARADDDVVRFAAPAGDALAFEFPLGVGSFRGSRDNTSGDFRGHWLSDPSTFMYSHFAAPLTLRSVGKGHWIGQIERFDQRFSVYIQISGTSSPNEVSQSGTVLRAFLRNPERNQGVNTRLHSVSRHGAVVTFKDSKDRAVLIGRLSDDQQVLSVVLPGRGGTYDLRRLERGEAAGFYPRRSPSDYRYEAPMEDADGWAVAHADTMGLRVSDVEALVRRIAEDEASSIRSPYIHSLLIARRGKLVVDEYFHGYHADRLHDLRSATKSVTGLMTGVALAEQDQLTIDSKVYPIFDRYSAKGARAAERRRSSLSLYHLLTMSSGYDCDDNEYATPGNEDRMQEQSEQPDWWQYTLSLPMANDPGAKAVYCSAGVNLLGGVVSTISDEWLPAFFDSRFARPMGITHYQMNLDPLKRGYAGGGIRMRPRDFLKFGQLMLDGGQWQGRALVPEEWIRRSMQGQASIHAQNDYGLTWWVSQVEVQGQTLDVVSATGNGGQMLLIVPERDLVVGFTGGNYGDFRTWISWRERLLPDVLLPALVN